MNDRYSQLVNLPVAGDLAKRIGLPQPVALDRFRPGDPLIKGRVLLGGAGRVAQPAAEVLRDAGADSATALDDPVREVAAAAGLDAAVFNPEAPADQRFKALVFDATGIERAADLVELQHFFYPTVSRVRPSGRVVVFGTPPGQAGSIDAATAQRALEGFTRSLAKEVGRGATVQLVYVAPGAEDQIASTLRFLLSPRSAYVSAQVIHITPSDRHPAIDWERPLAGRAALVTGASRGIGAAIAETLERDGARVIRLDMPGTGADIELDITAADAPAVIAERCADGLDILVHNAGITRDRTLAKMPEDRWQQVLDVNLVAQERINARGGRPAARGRADRLRLLHERHRRQRGPDELRHLQGRRDRAGAGHGAGGGRASHHHQRRRPGVHRDPDDRGHADRRARGRAAHELAAPGRPAGGRGGDDRLVRLAGVGGRERQRRPGVRPIAARRMTIREAMVKARAAMALGEIGGGRP